MASTYKTSKAELVAIYRLEFYKNKKNWKFCKDGRKDPDQVQETVSHKQTENFLNKTYSIDEAEPVGEGTSTLNKAFLEVEPGELPPVSSNNEGSMDYSKTLISSQSPAAPQPWAGCEPPAQDWTASGMEPHQWEVLDKRMPLDKCEVFSTNQVDGEWSTASNGNQWYEGCHREIHSCPEGHVLDGWEPEAVLLAADRWLRPHSAHSKDIWECSSDSVRQFLRGAAAAPHSSELDLRDHAMKDGAGLLELGEADVAGLSNEQLRVGVENHTKALRKLLAEARTRDQMVHHCQSLDQSTQHPTRDPGFSLSLSHSRPTTPLMRQDTYVKDTFLAGSFRNVPDEPGPGRGRGRLRSRPGVIGIGMGRPYRM